MKAVVTYKTIIITDGGNIQDDSCEVLPGDTPIERIFKRREAIHEDPNRLVYDIQIKFPCDGND